MDAILERHKNAAAAAASAIAAAAPTAAAGGGPASPAVTVPSMPSMPGRAATADSGANDDLQLTSLMDDLLSQSSSLTTMRAGTAPAPQSSMTMMSQPSHGRFLTDSLASDAFASPSALHRLGGDGGGGGGGGGIGGVGHQHYRYQNETKDGAGGGDGGGGGADDHEDSKKADHRLRVGYYQMMGTGKPVVRYCFIPKGALRKQDFDFDEAFAALQLRTPDLVFDLNSATDVENWNLRLPNEYKMMQVKEMFDPENKSHGISPPLKHYQGVVRANTRRLLRATATACSQAGAVFRTSATWDMKEDCVAEWAAETGDVDILLVAGRTSFYKEFYELMAEPGRSNPFSTTVPENPDDTELLIRNRIKIKVAQWQPTQDTDGQTMAPKRQPVMDEGSGTWSAGLPHPCGSHVIITDGDIRLLEKKIEQRVPTGYIIINGRMRSINRFCTAVQDSKPCFVFKHTGDAADLICEALRECKNFAKERRFNARAKPKRPFLVSIQEGYQSEKYLWRMDKTMVASCQALNILLDNFPHTFNPLSVLDIDMFTMTEEKLQDQLTKTMSVAFEGMVEMGGQALESKRLTYAWRMHHLFETNCVRLKRFADTMEGMVIVMTMLSTCASVIYTFLKSTPFVEIAPQTSNGVGIMADDYGLVALNLLLPLAISVLRSMISAMSPGSKALALRTAMVKIEFEIYTYRTKTGKYNSRKPKPKKTDEQQQQLQQQQQQSELPTRGKDDELKPSKVLFQAVEEIWAELLSSDITKGALIVPATSSDPLFSTNLIIQSNIKLQRTYFDNLKAPVPANFVNDYLMMGLPDNTMLGRAKAFLPMFFGGSGGTNDTANGGKAGGAAAPAAKAVPAAVAEPHHRRQSISNRVYAEGAGGASGEKDGQDIERGKGGDDGMNRDDASNAGDKEYEDMQAMEGGGDDKNKPAAQKIILDNGLEMLSADEYIKIRLIPFLAMFLFETPYLSRVSQVVKGATILLSVFSSILSTMDLIALIPGVLALSGAAAAWVGYSQVDLTILAKNHAINQLNKHLAWWDSLSLIEKRVAQNKEFLVRMTEIAIQSQVLGFTSHEGSKSSEDKKDGDDKEEGAGKK